MATTNTTQEDIVSKTKTIFDRLDERRSNEIANLTVLKKTQDDNLQLEQQRLTEKYGADHPIVQRIATQSVYNRQLFNSLAKEQARSSIKTSPFEISTWRIEGIVYNAESKPQKEMTIFLSDSNRQWNKDSGIACSNEQGYYSLSLHPNTAHDILNLSKEGQLFLSVSDKTQQILYTNKEPIEIVFGKSDYKDIFLTNDKCIPPIFATKG